MSVQCIELLRRGCKGHWGMYGYMYMGCATHGDFRGGVGGDRIGNILLNYIDTAL